MVPHCTCLSYKDAAFPFLFSPSRFLALPQQQNHLSSSAHPDCDDFFVFFLARSIADSLGHGLLHHLFRVSSPNLTGPNKDGALSNIMSLLLRPLLFFYITTPVIRFPSPLVQDHDKSTDHDFCASIQAIRRSLKSDKERSHHVSVTPKSALAILPPKKVRLVDYLPAPPRSAAMFIFLLCSALFFMPLSLSHSLSHPLFFPFFVIYHFSTANPASPNIFGVIISI